MTAIATTHTTTERGARIATPTTRPPQPEVRSEAPEVHEIDAAHIAHADARTEARVAEALGAATIRDRARNVYVSVSDGIVTLYGAVRDCTARRDIEAEIRKAARSEVIRNQIHCLGARAAD